MKKIILLSLILLLIFVLCVISIASFPKPDIEILTKKNSGIKDFYIENEMVHIVTGLTLKNNLNSTVQFILTAESIEDYESGLITSPTLHGYNETLTNKVFSINENEKITIDVVFVGTHGKNDKKVDRLLPEIKVQKTGDGSMS